MLFDHVLALFMVNIHLLHHKFFSLNSAFKSKILIIITLRVNSAADKV